MIFETTTRARLSSTSRLLLRIGIAFAFLYPPIAAWSDPYSWIGYFPGFVLNLAGDYSILLLHSFGVVEIVIALWILSGRKILLPSLTAALMLILIVLFNLSQMDVVFRDVAIAFMALALAANEHERDTAQS